MSDAKKIGKGDVYEQYMNLKKGQAADEEDDDDVSPDSDDDDLDDIDDDDDDSDELSASGPQDKKAAASKPVKKAEEPTESYTQDELEFSTSP